MVWTISPRYGILQVVINWGVCFYLMVPKQSYNRYVCLSIYLCTMKQQYLRVNNDQLYATRANKCYIYCIAPCSLAVVNLISPVDELISPDKVTGGCLEWCLSCVTNIREAEEMLGHDGESPWEHMHLTHWGRVMHIWVSKLTILGWDNGLSPSWCQAIIWANADILLIWTLGTNLSEILNEIDTFFIQENAFAKWHLFYLNLNELEPRIVMMPTLLSLAAS